MSKAQAQVTDLFIAIFVSFLLLIAILSFWKFYISRLNSDINYEDMQITAFQISDTLVKSAGMPISWEENVENVKVIGLANSDRNLSKSKVDAFMNLSYDEIRNSMHISNYDFYFSIKNLTNGEILNKGNNFTGEISISLDRYVFYDDKNAIMEFTLWK